VSWRLPGAGWCPGCFGWLELADLAGDDEADLFADVDGMVAEPLQETATSTSRVAQATALGSVIWLSWRKMWSLS
jgi:hypothetical protein